MLENYLKEKAIEVDRMIEEFLPKNIDEAWVKENLPYFNGSEKLVNELMTPVWELLQRGGKRWRPVLMMLCCDAVGGGSKIKDLMPLVEIIHNGTLMVDDVEDGSQIRRDKPCIHKIFGVDVAINTGNMMYYLPHLILKKSDLDKKTKLAIYDLINEEMLKLSIGQGIDINWHNGGKDASEEEYLQMCSLKTGTLARMSAKIGAIVGNAKKRQIDKLGNFAESIGVAFQIQDDILNLTNRRWGKEFGEDITEGKKSIMVIRTLNIAEEPDKNRLLEILKMKTKDKWLIEEAIKLMKKYKAIKYSHELSKEIIKKAWKDLDPWISDSESKNKLKLFADFAIGRKI